MPTATTMSINGAPVLTLGAAIVAERSGIDRSEVCRLGPPACSLASNASSLE
jgi:hypothetical protein